MPRGANRFALLTALAVVAAAVAAAAAMPAPAQAAPRTFVANKLGDRAPGPCRPGDCTLREAIIAANANAGRDTIRLRGGRRYQLRRSGTDDDARAGDLDVTDRVLIRARGRRPATIDANRIDRVLHIPSSGAGTKLAGVIVRGGDASVAGGIWAESRLELVRSTVAANRSAGAGGIRAGGQLVLRGSRIVNNRGGAGIFTAGGIDASSAIHEVLIANSVIRRNLGAGIGGAEIEGPATIRGSTIAANPGRPGRADRGGGLALNGPTRIVRTTIANNRGESEGGVDATGLGGGERLVVRRSLIRSNTATRSGFGDGAGIKAYARLRLLRSRVLGNRAGGSGGGVANRGERTLIAATTFRANRSQQPGGALSLTDTIAPNRARISRSTVRNNRSFGDGGGISYVVSETGSLLQTTNSTIARNRADDNGGGLELRGGTVNLNAITVARNRANAAESGWRGGGISQGLASGVGAAVVVANSLIALNRVGDDGSGPQCSGTYTSGGGNLITARPGCTDLDGPNDRVRANPRIGVIGPHGGPTATIPLLRRSPAINAARGTAPPRDQRGVRRGSPDSGAFERR